MIIMGFIKNFLILFLIGGAVYFFQLKIAVNQGLSDAKAQTTETITVPTDLKFLPSDDVTVSSKSSPNNGTTLTVAKSKSIESRTYLKFEVSGVTTNILSAKVLMHAKVNSKQGGTLARVNSTTWTETNMTWSNKPALGTVLASITTAVNKNNFGNTGNSLGDYYEWDVTSAVTANGTYAFGVTCTNCSSTYNSSEDTKFQPFLVLTVEKSVPAPVVTDVDPVVVGAGDIADCTSQGDEATANLLDGIPGTVLTLGDNAYEDGSLTDFNNCYSPSWGRHKARTKPAIGNHEYHTDFAAGYFDYFGAAAGDRDKGYYSYDLGNWHVVVLNSDCNDVPGGCAIGSPQETWLKADLAANPANCTLAYFHHARYTSGTHSSDPKLDDLWKDMVEANVDLALVGHDHNYERMAPLDEYGMIDYQRGIRHIKVGTGGASHSSGYNTPIAGSEKRDITSFGVLKVNLHPASFDFQYIPEAGKTFTDSGMGLCH